jgi:predicted transcriptional regulator
MIERGFTMKAKTIQIKSVEQSLKEFTKVYKAIAARRPVKKQTGTFFASAGAVRKVLSDSRIKLLQAIKRHKPQSIYELAKCTNRDFKNVSQDIAFLRELGLVELARPGGVRRKRRPTLVSDHIYFEIAI